MSKILDQYRSMARAKKRARQIDDAAAKVVASARAWLIHRGKPLESATLNMLAEDVESLLRLQNK